MDILLHFSVLKFYLFIYSYWSFADFEFHLAVVCFHFYERNNIKVGRETGRENMGRVRVEKREQNNVRKFQYKDTIILKNS